VVGRQVNGYVGNHPNRNIDMQLGQTHFCRRSWRERGGGERENVRERERERERERGGDRQTVDEYNIDITKA